MNIGSSKARRNTLTKKSSLRNNSNDQPPRTLTRSPSVPYNLSSTSPVRSAHQRTQSTTPYASSQSSLAYSANSRHSPIVNGTDWFPTTADAFQSSFYPPTPTTMDEQTLPLTQQRSIPPSIPPLMRPAPPPQMHTSPDLRFGAMRLSDSQNMATANGSAGSGLVEITPPRSETGEMGAKRASQDVAQQLKPLRAQRKKSGFSSFMNSMLGSPRQIKISAPENPTHITHVCFDEETGQFTGLPKNWEQMLSDNGVPDAEQKQNPQMMYNIMRTYETNFGGQDDEVYHKFDNAKTGDSPQSTSSGTRQSPASGLGISAALANNTSPTSIISPPSSPRFPQNHEGSFENPRAPPPIPPGAKPGVSSPPLRGSRIPQSAFAPHRAAPKAPITQPQNSPIRPSATAPQIQSNLPPRNNDFLPPPPKMPEMVQKSPGAGEIPSAIWNQSRSRSNSAANMPKPLPINVPPPPSVNHAAQYQMEQEKAMAAAQQAVIDKQLDRSRSQSNRAPPPPPKPIQPTPVIARRSTISTKTEEAASTQQWNRNNNTITSYM